VADREDAPPGLEEKLQAPRSTGGKARCKLHHLMTRFGFRVLEQDNRGPLLVEVCPMDRAARWRRVGAEKDAWFELES
jgi:hypothetical protein